MTNVEKVSIKYFQKLMEQCGPLCCFKDHTNHYIEAERKVEYIRKKLSEAIKEDAKKCRSQLNEA